MKKIYYKNDFCILLDLYDEEGERVGFPPYDFSLTVMSGGRQFKAFRKGKLSRNVTEKDGKMLVVCDNHGLAPGYQPVSVEFAADIPDALYADGMRHWVKKVTTDITLTVDDNDDYSGDCAIVIPGSPTPSPGSCGCPTAEEREQEIKNLVGSELDKTFEAMTEEEIGEIADSIFNS